MLVVFRLTEEGNMAPHVRRLESRWMRVGKLSLHVKTGMDLAPARRLPLVHAQAVLNLQNRPRRQVPA
jgi:hypothetical protein